MKQSSNIIKVVPFVELLAVTSIQSNVSVFDVVIDEPIILENYCNCLINIILTLSQSKFSSFISYQLQKARDPLGWLDSFDDLILKNEKLFIKEGVIFRYQKITDVIEKQRKLLQCPVKKPIKPTIDKKYINAESEERYFSFYELKKQLSTLEDDNEKILLLIKEKHDYKQSYIEFLNQKLPLFVEQCSKEIKQIYEIQSIKSTIVKSKQNTEVDDFTKIKFNCNVNQFVDVFYQMTREIYIEGKPMLEGNINDVASIIVNSFVDKEGKELSPMSVKTILKPSREDKRPNTEKRIDISKMLKF